jgi:cell division protein ZipA
VAELRWLLFLIGIGVVAAVYIYTRYKPHIDGRVRAMTFRKEPSIDGSSIDGSVNAEYLSADESMADPDMPPPSIASEPRKVVAIRLMSKNTVGFVADRLILILRELGLRHGQFGIFHRMDKGEDENSAAVFSVASLIEPGSFDLTKIKSERYLGVSIFLTLPGPCDGVSAFDDMMDLARELAQRLDGYLLDEQGGTLSVQRERYMREEIIQFEHQESG